MRDGTERGPCLRYFGDYELEREIAPGGMGVVFQARQTSLNRMVAVKMILKGQLATEADVRRFRAEAEAAAHLQHTNIVAIHEIGEHDEQHYFSMDYVDGPNLAELAAEGPLPPVRAAQLVKTLAEAIHFAHQQGILHRDLKPSNILIDPFDQPKITDFGLAKRMESESDLTQSGQLLGTPHFMPPEQASTRHGTIGPQSDVYSLGAILYFLLAGRPPFGGGSTHDTVHSVLNDEPAFPASSRATIPNDLEVICLKCLQKDARRRYSTARALAEDLDRFLKDEAIHARASGHLERLWRAARRHRLPLAAGASIGLLTLALVAAVVRNLKNNRAASPIHRAISSMPVRSGQGASGLIDGKVYLFTPLDGYAGIRNFLHVYDLERNNWKRLEDIPTSRTCPSSGVIGHKFFVAGGLPLNAQASKVLEAYDPESGHWSAKASMPTARCGAASAVINGRLYVFGGSFGAELLASVESYDPGLDRWQAEAPLLVARVGCGATLINGTVYISGGFTNIERNAVTSLLETWTPNGGRQIISPVMPKRVSVGYAFAAALNGFLYISGGETATGEAAAFEVYWPERKEWEPVSPMPEARWGGSGVEVINGEFWAFGGWTSFSVNSPLPHADVFIYNPIQNLWRRSTPNSSR